MASNRRGNPQNLTSWKPGESGNPGGRTKEQIAKQRRNGEIATEIRTYLLESHLEQIENARLAIELGQDPKGFMIEVNSDLLRLLTDSENRGFGTPVARTEISGKDGEPIQEVRRVVVDPKMIEEKGEDDV